MTINATPPQTRGHAGANTQVVALTAELVDGRAWYFQAACGTPLLAVFVFGAFWTGRLGGMVLVSETECRSALWCSSRYRAHIRTHIRTHTHTHTLAGVVRRCGSWRWIVISGYASPRGRSRSLQPQCVRVLTCCLKRAQNHTPARTFECMHAPVNFSPLCLPASAFSGDKQRVDGTNTPDTGFKLHFPESQGKGASGELVVSQVYVVFGDGDLTGRRRRLLWIRGPTRWWW